MSTITDWLKSLELKAGDRITDGERVFGVGRDCVGVTLFEYKDALIWDAHCDLPQFQHPEHWRRVNTRPPDKHCLMITTLVEEWKRLSSYDDWARERKALNNFRPREYSGRIYTEQPEAPEPWAELRRWGDGIGVHGSAVVEDMIPHLEAAWPELERRIKKMMGEK